jgi:hypothetical protein
MRPTARLVLMLRVRRARLVDATQADMQDSASFRLISALLQSLSL